MDMGSESMRLTFTRSYWSVTECLLKGEEKK